MKQYADGFKEKIKPRMNEEGKQVVEPFRDAQFALSRATFYKNDVEHFFNGAYVEILTELFSAWLKTEPHCQKEREYLYSVAMALGSVKEKLVHIHQYGKNAESILKTKKQAQEGAEGNEQHDNYS